MAKKKSTKEEQQESVQDETAQAPADETAPVDAPVDGIEKQDDDAAKDEVLDAALDVLQGDDAAQADDTAQDMPQADDAATEAAPAQQEPIAESTDDKSTVDDDPEPELEPLGTFRFRGELTGVKMKATKDGLRKVLQLESKMLRTLRDIDQYLEQDFDIVVSIAYSHYRKTEKTSVKQQKGEDLQAELPLEQSDSDHANEVSATEPGTAPVQDTDVVDGGDQEAGTDQGEGAEESAPVETEQPDQQGAGGVATQYICEPCSSDEEVSLVTIEGDDGFLMCPKCNTVYSNPDHEEPEM